VATYQILYWHTIPIQVRARGDGGRASIPLPARFQDAADRAAMAAGHIEAGTYTDGFRWGEAHEREGTAQEVATVVAAELEAQQPEVDWQAVARALRG